MKNMLGCLGLLLVAGVLVGEAYSFVVAHHLLGTHARGLVGGVRVSDTVLPILLLVGSNVFMTLAWYGHLRFKEVPLLTVIVASWAIAFVEYCLAVPANRWGSAVYSTAQLKTIQEVVTLLIFAAFSILYLKEPMTWNYAIGFALVAAGAFFVFRGPL